MKLADPEGRAAARADLRRLLIGLTLMTVAAFASLFSSDDEEETAHDRGAAAQSLARD